MNRTNYEKKSTFSLNWNKDEAGALVDVVCLFVELQGGLVLCVIDVHFGAGHLTQQSVHGHAQLHCKALDAFEHVVVVDDDGTHFGVLTLVKLNLQNQHE